MPFYQIPVLEDGSGPTSLYSLATGYHAPPLAPGLLHCQGGPLNLSTFVCLFMSVGVLSVFMSVYHMCL